MGLASTPEKNDEREGPIARTIIFFGCVPVTMNPPIRTLSAVSTRRRVEMLPNTVTLGVPVGVALGVAVAVGVALTLAVGVGVGEGVGAIVAVAVDVAVGVDVGVADGVGPIALTMKLVAFTNVA